MNGTQFTSANESADLTEWLGYTGHKCARKKEELQKRPHRLPTTK